MPPTTRVSRYILKGKAASTIAQKITMIMVLPKMCWKLAWSKLDMTSLCSCPNLTRKGLLAPILTSTVGPIWLMP